MQRLSIMEHPAMEHPVGWPAPRRRQVGREEDRAKAKESSTKWWLALAALCGCAFAAGWFVPTLFPRLAAQRKPPSISARDTAQPVITPAAADVPPEPTALTTADVNIATPSPYRPVTTPLAGGMAPLAAAANPTIDFRDRARARFVASLGRTQEIVPGLQFHIDRITAPTNHFDGWLQSTDGTGRAVSLENVSLLQAIPFSGKDGRRLDLIVTDLQPDHLTGYVILPAAN